ncbi:MAG: sigma-54-dependent Fis family transcriptional regulator [Planctomycetota bacterium]|nr:MAG: sigma-54-dependent Fis family transcriptional regulator [Planctomycetota bacterium]
MRRIVVVSGQDQVQKLAHKIAQEVFVADDLAEALDITETVSPDLLVFDSRFSPDHIRQFLDTTDKNQISVPVIVIGDDRNHPGLSEDFIRMGACDYICGKQDYSRLQEIVGRITDKPKAAQMQTSLSDFFAEQYAASVKMVGRSKALRDQLKMIKLVADSCCNPVLIVGETGTGKELAAKAVHLLRHSNEQFIAVNCAALTANLLESELFGHVKGSFTGADREKTGLLELAGSGTIFLDEISEMPMDLQAKLLRVLQEKNFRKVGGTSTIPCNATIIASSNRNLQKQIRAGRFRRDLYYRLNICPINIAPLRAPGRSEDIKLLAEYFLKTSTICPEKAGRITSLTKLALEALQKHAWPGNVRELSNVIERAIMLETTDKIGLSSIMIDSPPNDESSDGPTNDHVTNFSLEKAERELISRALRETGWQKTRAAALLGITRATLYAKVKQYNIEKGLLVKADCGKQTPGEIPATHHSESVAVP